ncbi:MAG: NADH-quinone oxidoreductase subunit C [Elusimicrobia bacterium]|nr:NADH-quinone oxidoreductase subunit C [Elusimicrobiota bacterium]
MSNEETIKNELTGKFSFIGEKIRIQRERRIFADIDFPKFSEVFDYAVKNMSFTVLCTITGLDEGDNFAFYYHLARRDGTMLNIKTFAPKSNPTIKTVTNYFPSAHIYERELEDLFGIKVEGLPSGQRYPLPDNWPVGQYPLRKDWKIENLKK